MGKNFQEQMLGSGFKAEWDALEPERQAMRAIADERAICVNLDAADEEKQEGA